MTNNKLFGLISLETLASFIVAIFFVGVAWQSVAGDLKVQKLEVEEVKAQQETMAKDIEQIKLHIKGIATEQKVQGDYVKRDLSEMKQNMRQLLDRIR